MMLECQNCGHDWDYQGGSDHYATCPNCSYKVKIPASTESVDPEKVELTHLDEEENQFLNELAVCEDEEDFKKVCLKYDQTEFNVLKRKTKEKIQQKRKDLKLYRQVEDAVDSASWEYYEL